MHSLRNLKAGHLIIHTSDVMLVRSETFPKLHATVAKVWKNFVSSLLTIVPMLYFKGENFARNNICRIGNKN